MPERPFSRAKRSSLRQALDRRQNARAQADGAKDPTASAAQQETPRVDEALLEARVREEIARQVRRARTRTDPAPRTRLRLDPTRLREVVRREVARQLAPDARAARSESQAGELAVDNELLQDAVRRVLRRRLRRQGDRPEAGEPSKPAPRVTPALLEPLVRDELGRLLGRAGQRRPPGSAPVAIESGMLRAKIREEMERHLHAGRRPHDAPGLAPRLASSDRALAGKQIRAVLRRCLARPSALHGRPLSDETIDEIVKGALRRRQ